MFLEISDGVEIGTFNIMDEYNPDSLENNTGTFDKYLQKNTQPILKAVLNFLIKADLLPLHPLQW